MTQKTKLSSRICSGLEIMPLIHQEVCLLEDRLDTLTHQQIQVLIFLKSVLTCDNIPRDIVCQAKKLLSSLTSET